MITRVAGALAGALLVAVLPAAGSAAAPAGHRPAATLTRLWHTPLQTNYPVGIGGGNFYRVENGGPDAGIVAVRTTDGTRRWARTFAGSDGLFPIGESGRVFAAAVFTDGAATRKVVGLDAATGRIRWSVPDVFEGTVDDTEVYLVSYDFDSGVSTTSAYVGATGRRLWTVPGFAPIRGGVGSVFGVCGLGQELCALDARTGATRWTNPAATFVDQLGLTGDSLISGDDTIQGWDARTGRLLWTDPPIPPTVGQVRNSGQFAVGDGRVYVAGQDLGFAQYTPLPTRKARLWALDAATGRLVWTAEEPGYYIGQFTAYAAGSVAVQCTTSADPAAWQLDHLCALDARTGGPPAVSAPFGEPFLIGPVTDGRRFFVAESSLEAWAVGR